MRTAILLTGFIFADLLTKHWGLPIYSDETHRFLVYFLCGAIVLDIVKA